MKPCALPIQACITMDWPTDSFVAWFGARHMQRTAYVNKKQPDLFVIEYFLCLSKGGIMTAGYRYIRFFYDATAQPIVFHLNGMNRDSTLTTTPIMCDSMWRFANKIIFFIDLTKNTEATVDERVQCEGKEWCVSRIRIHAHRDEPKQSTCQSNALNS